GEDGNVNPHPRAALDGRPAGARAFGAQGAHVIGNGDAGSQEGIVLDRGELGHVDVAVNLDVAADAAAVVNDRVAPDAHVVADDVLLADDHVVARLQAATDGRAGVDDRTGANIGSGSDAYRAVGDGAARGIAPGDPPGG